MNENLKVMVISHVILKITPKYETCVKIVNVKEFKAGCHSFLQFLSDSGRYLEVFQPAICNPQKQT